jgi:phosphonate transport system substrate-binding protein
VLPAERLHYRVFARTGARDRIAGIIVVRRSAGITRIRDLAGRTLCFSRPDALASAMLVRRWLWESSFALREARRIIYAGSQESAVLQVYLGNADAAGVSRDGWAAFAAQYPHALPELETKWQTNGLSGPAVMAHSRISREHVQQMLSALTSLIEAPLGRSALLSAGVSEFRPGESASYDDVWEFVTDYRRLFGPPERALLSQ